MNHVWFYNTLKSMNRPSLSNTIYIYHVSIIQSVVLHQFIVALSFRPNDTAELMEEAGQVALCSNQLTSMDSTDALLKASPLAKPEENTSFTVPTVVSKQQLDSKVQDNEQPDIKVNPGIERNSHSFC